MIHYDEIEVGSVYSPTQRMNTTDYSHPMDIKTCFTVIDKGEISFFGKKRFRFEIIYNDLKQVILVSPIKDTLHSKMLPFKKVI